jgi:SAM-dependent methyltransferase
MIFNKSKQKGGELFAEPRRVDSVDSCRFYHSMTLPGHGEVAGDWDLRPSIDAYFGGVDFEGKRALDVGTASGYLTFEMEKRGADIVSFDIGEDEEWDVVPHSSLDVEREKRNRRNSRDPLLNSYWFAHAAHDSKAKAFYGDIYALPYELGDFDVVMLGTVLSHLRDPFKALESAGKLVPVGGEVVIVDGYLAADVPIQRLIPTRENEARFAWWRSSPPMVAQMLSVLGFGEPRMSHTDHLQVIGFDQPKPTDLMTYVAKREIPWAGGA